MEETILKQILAELQHTNKRLDTLEQGQKEMRTDITEIRSDITEVRSDITEIRSDITEVRSDITEIRSDITEVRSDITEIRSDITEVRSDITEIRSDNTAMRADISEIKQGQEQLQKNIIASLGEYTEKISEHVDDKTAALNKRVFTLETDMQRMSRQ